MEFTRTIRGYEVRAHLQSGYAPEFSVMGIGNSSNVRYKSVEEAEKAIEKYDMAQRKNIVNRRAWLRRYGAPPREVEVVMVSMCGRKARIRRADVNDSSPYPVDLDMLFARREDVEALEAMILRHSKEQETAIAALERWKPEFGKQD